MIPPTIGNADPDWPAPRGGVGAGAVVVQVQAIDAYPNPLPRKCVWAMLLLSCLLVLRVQQDRYAEVVHWRHGVPDMGNPFPWELKALVSGNDSFEATFLSPILPKASTFLRSPAEATMLITGLTQAIVAGGDGSSLEQPAGSPMLGISAVTSSADLPPPTCHGNGTSCFMGMQRASVPARALQQLNSGGPSPVACHRVLAGGSPQAMRPFPADANRSQLLCIRSTRIQALVPTRANGSTVVAWAPPPSRTRQQVRKQSPACLSVLTMPELKVGPTLLVDSATTVLFDQGSNLFVTVGFSAIQQIIVKAFDPTNLKPLLYYKLPLSVAWLLRAPRVSDGFLLFVGSEEPFLGTIITVDLKKSEVYEQDPPALGSSRRRPRRRRLPRAMVAERPAVANRPSSPAIAAGTKGPCAAIAVPDLQSGHKIKGTGTNSHQHNQGSVSEAEYEGLGKKTPAATGEKAGPPGPV